jgi:IS1 family transposase
LFVLQFIRPEVVVANVLKFDKQVQVLHSLVEGNSVRSTERMFDVHRDTIIRLMVRVGDGCANLLDEKMRDLRCRRLELDELWAYVGKKQRHVTMDDPRVLGDTWTYVAIDSESKLVPSFMTGKRDEATTDAFIRDLAGRIRDRVQITTDGLKQYISPIGRHFPLPGTDYASIVKTYEAEPVGPGRYSPPKVTGTQKTPIFGEPVEEWVSTSYVERQNLSIRMGVRRFTRLTNAFSKKLENHGAHVALWMAYYDLVRVHSTVRTTPAVAAGVTDREWTLPELIEEAKLYAQEK